MGVEGEAGGGFRRIPVLAGFRRGARALRTLPRLGFAPWARREISRILPEFEEGDGPPPALDEAFSRLRFFEACVEFLRRICAHPITLWIEDLHCCDPLTAELGAYLFHAQANGEFTAPSVVTYRPRSLPKELEDAIEILIEKGDADRVELPPLSAAEVGELVADLDLPETLRLGSLLFHVVGGNPGAILRSLETTLAPPSSLGEAALPTREEELVRKLGRLSETALQLARVAALAGEAFSPELAASTLGLHPLRHAEPWSELEDAGILDDAGFVHDLLREAVLAGLPHPLRKHLHEAILLGKADARKKRLVHPYH